MKWTVSYRIAVSFNSNALHNGELNRRLRFWSLTRTWGKKLWGPGPFSKLRPLIVNKRGDNSGGVSVSFCEPVFAATGAWHVAMAGAVVGPSRPECAPAFELPPSSGATVPQETQVQWAEASGMAARCTPALDSLSDEFPSKLTESECPEWNDVPERNIITRQQHANRELLHALRLMAEVAALNSRADWRLMVS